MTKLLSMIVAALFTAVSVSAIAASHAGAQDKGKMEKKDDKAPKKPSAEECKKDPKMKGCEMDKKMDKKADKMEKKQ